jgi:hypothetical protein
MGFYRGPRINRDGLVLALDAGSIRSYPGSGTTWIDLSGSGNNATLINGPTFDTENGGNIIFDDVDDHAIITDNPSINFPTALTVSLWLNTGNKITTSHDGDCFYIKGDSQNPSPSGSVDSGNPAIFIDGSYYWRGPVQDPANTTLRSSYEPPSGFLQTNTWYNLTYTHISTNDPIIYKNGVVQSGFTYSTGPRNSNGSLPLGTNNFNATIAGDQYRIIGVTASTTNEKIAAVHVYNRALSEEEVIQNFNALRARFGL